MSTRAMKASAVAVAGLLALSAAAYANHSWANYHWKRSSNPITLGLGDNVTSTWRGWLAEASTDWSLSSVLDTPVVSGQAGAGCTPEVGRIEVCNDDYGLTGWLGVAQIWTKGPHIERAVAKLNDTYHNSPPYNTNGWRDMVMCQEVGHTFGLGHQDENFNNGNLGTCMDYTNNPDGPPSNRAPNAHDYEQLEAIYAHLDGGGGGGCKGGPKQCPGKIPAPPAYGMSLDGPGQWGKLISVSRDGGQSLFVQDFGNGYRVFTHVTWTLEVARKLAQPGHQP